MDRRALEGEIQEVDSTIRTLEEIGNRSTHESENHASDELVLSASPVPRGHYEEGEPRRESCRCVPADPKN